MNPRGDGDGGGGDASALLTSLRPLLAFHKSFKAAHGRRATDDDVPPDLAGLIQLFKSHGKALAERDVLAWVPEAAPEAAPWASSRPP
ncbi:hypothetical protein FOA52_005049 [Chlamydomonas sp. UWO 241]|nr:hypothetical protein FOA52_005049 [Chlamydomonas sp. UWO 241]